MSNALTYFAYGANMSTAALASRLGTSLRRGEPAFVHGYDLRFLVRGHWPLVEGAFATARPSPDGKLFGVLHDLTSTQIALLDEHEGVQTGQNARIDGVTARTLSSSRQTECSLYVAGNEDFRLLEGTVQPSARYLLSMEHSSREVCLPEFWVERLVSCRAALQPVPRCSEKELRTHLTDSAPFSLVSESTATRAPLTSLCGLVFSCVSADSAVLPSIEGQECSLAVLRRAARTWADEAVPQTLDEALSQFGDERTTECLEQWLSQFHDIFGEPVAVCDEWKQHATPHRFVL